MFEIGKIYHRQNEIHGVWGGQGQGGMSTPRAHPLVFLFTGESGAEHGYEDKFKPDGTFCYTGEGQVGDQRFTNSNRALRDHRELGKTVHLFEEAGRGLSSYLGRVEYLGHHLEQRPDREGKTRNAIVFELGFIDYAAPSPSIEVSALSTLRGEGRLAARSLAELRRLALTGVTNAATVEERRRITRVRSDAVRAYVLKRAAGICEGCTNPAPFKTRRGTPYLEPHHTTRMADGGPDHPAHVIALCPTCHRRVHHAEDGQSYNDALKQWLVKSEGSA